METINTLSTARQERLDAKADRLAIREDYISRLRSISTKLDCISYGRMLVKFGYAKSTSDPLVGNSRKVMNGILKDEATLAILEQLPAKILQQLQS